MFEDLKDYAKEYKVPIIRDEGLEFLLFQIEKNGCKSALEVGTAIGYSAIRMAHLGLDITTLERNEEMFKEAISNIKKYNLENKIEAVYTDALLYTPSRKYDLIFIDAAKAQNLKFFLRFTPFLNDNGIVIVDNLNFHDLVNTPFSEIKSKNVRSLVRKISEFKEWLKNNPDWDTTFTDQGDGMSVSKRK